MGYADVGTERLRRQHYAESGDDGPAIFGSFLGHHSITECRDFAATIDFRVRATDALIAKHGLAASLPAVQRWQAFKDRWSGGSRRILLSLAAQASNSRIIAADRYPAEAEYRELRRLVNKSGDDTHADPGDMIPVIEGIEDLAQEPIDEKNHPEPTAGDPDLDAFQKLDAAIRTSEGITGTGPKPPKPWYSIPWWGYGLGLVFVGGVGYSFYRAWARNRPPALPAANYATLPVSSDMPLFHRDPATGVMIPVAVADRAPPTTPLGGVPAFTVPVSL